jgi:hypothetical protein
MLTIKKAGTTFLPDLHHYTKIAWADPITIDLN